MKVIAFAAVTGGGKTTVVHALKAQLPDAASLHFDDYRFAGEVTDYAAWHAAGADVHVWDLSPLKEDIARIRRSGSCACLLLDYPFAYQHRMIREELDCCIFIDTPLDIAMARRVLRDMQDAAAAEICGEMEAYLQYARPLYVQMRAEHLAESDYVIDGAQPLDAIVREALEIIHAPK